MPQPYTKNTRFNCPDCPAPSCIPSCNRVFGYELKVHLQQAEHRQDGG